MRVGSWTLPAPTWLSPSEQCRLRLVHEALDWVDILLVWGRPLPEWLDEPPAVSSSMVCSWARRVRRDSEHLTEIGGCGVSGTLVLTESTLTASPDVTIATFGATGRPIVDGVSVASLVRLHVDREQVLRFVLAE